MAFEHGQWQAGILQDQRKTGPQKIKKSQFLHNNWHGND